MKIENEIISSVIAAVKELYGQDVPETKDLSTKSRVAGDCQARFREKGG